MKNIDHNRVKRRKLRVSSNIRGTGDRPRIIVNRSNRYVLVQAIDDIKRITLAAVSSIKLAKDKNNKTMISKQAGIELAKKLLDKKIDKAIFDRGQYAYKGRIKALAEGLREGGIEI